MYSKTNNQNNRNYQLHSQSGNHTNKNYLNYINFQSNLPQKNSQHNPNRQPDQVATYSINVNPHPQPRSGTPQSANNINRNAYLNKTGQLPKQTYHELQRNSSNKDPFMSRKSQQTNNHNNLYNKTSPHGFHRASKQIDTSNKTNNYGSQTPAYIGSPNYSKTMDMASVKSQQLERSGHKHHQEDQLKQKLNYLEVLEHSLKQYQRTRAPNDLRQLNEDNRLLMLGVFQQVNKLKDERSRKTISDNISQSDNYSQSAYSSAQDKSQSRSNSIHSKRRYMQGLSRSKEKARNMEKDIEHERRLNEKLTIQYDQQMKKFNTNSESELEKITASIAKQQEQIKKLNAANDQIASKITHLPFHHQWKIMCGEADGAKRAKIKIQQELAKRQEKLNKILQQSTGNKKVPVKSQETTGNQQKPFDGSASKKPTSNMKVPPSPLPRPGGQSGSNRGIKQTSLRQFGSQNRSKSNNRYNTSS